MKSRFLVVQLFALAAVLVLSASAISQTYVGVDLYTLQTPAEANNFVNFAPSFAAGGQVVGTMRNGFDGIAGAEPLLWKAPMGQLTYLSAHEPQNRFLNPTWMTATDGVHQVGYGSSNATSPGSSYQHALLWTGSSASVVDLDPHPSGVFGVSSALGIGGGKQVGSVDGRTGGMERDSAVNY